MQNHARKYQLPIDTVTYGYDMRDESVEDVLKTGPPADGALTAPSSGASSSRGPGGT